jgi:hypothetical protein
MPLLEDTVIVNLPLPRKPRPTDARARRVLEWADVIYYIFWLAFSAIVAVVAFALYGPAILT